MASSQCDLAGIPALNNIGVNGALRILPGSKEDSVLYQMMIRTTAPRMPQLSASPDEEGAAQIDAWIDSLDGD